MKRVRSMLVAAALASAGCSGEGAGPSHENAQGSHSALLFEDHYSETGKIQVHDLDGHLALQVTGGIGTDDHLAIGELLASGDLSHVFLALHPEVESAPDELRAIDARWQRQLAEAAEVPEVKAAVAERSRSAGAPPLVDKSRSSFLNTACQTFGPWFDQWIPDLCLYTPSATGLVQVNCTNSSCNSRWIHHAGDRAFVWNEGSRASLVGFLDINAQGNLVNHSQGTIAAQTWGFFSNDFDTVNYGVQSVSGAHTPPFGLTHHWHKVTPR